MSFSPEIIPDALTCIKAHGTRRAELDGWRSRDPPPHRNEGATGTAA
jgi:hypothetical protein